MSEIRKRPGIRKRVVLHFPGFEPLDAGAHHRRYVRSAMQSGEVWNYDIEAGPLGGNPDARSFTVQAAGPDWRTETRVHIFDHNDLITALRAKPVLVRLATGYLSAARVAWYGGMFRYFRHAWRFGLFFLFPFVLVALGMAALLFAASLPVLFGSSNWNLVWSLPAAGLVFFKIFLPVAEKIHTLHQFDDWKLAISLGRLEDKAVNARLERCVAAACLALQEEADEYLVTSHSMGSSVATHVLGSLLERQPDILAGKAVVFATLGGTVLQCALLRPATALRRRVGVVAGCSGLFWLDVQCLTDVISFYRAKVVEVVGFPDLPQARILFTRFKYMLNPDHYRRIKRDFLRMHRQYVLGPDRRANYDFSLLTAGPFPARDFVGFTPENPPPLSANGSVTPDAATVAAG